MKNIFLIPIFIFLGLQVQGRFILVNNNDFAIDKFKSSQVAYDSAAVGDTIYLVPSPTTYQALIIKKRITLLGAGFKDNNGVILKQFSRIFGVVVDTSNIFSVKTSGTIISGLYFNGTSGHSIDIKGTVKNIYLFNCFISSYNNFKIGNDNAFVFDNIINSSVTLFNNVLFRNNIVTGNIAGNVADNIVGGINCNISYNVFLGSTPISNLNGSAITNNIFYTPNGVISTTAPGQNNSYSNNIQGGSDLGPGNLKSVDLSTVFQENISSASETVLINLSFLLKPGSPALTAGSSGGEIGVYGGNYPWPKGIVYTRSPGTLPVVTELFVQNQTVAPGGTIKFNFKAKSLK